MDSKVLAQVELDHPLTCRRNW